MTNRQWLLEQMQNMSDDEFAEILHKGRMACEYIGTRCAMDWVGDEEEEPTCEECIVIWLDEQHMEPIKLSDAERVILENIDKKYKWITRERDGRLHVHKNKPEKGGCWCTEWDSKTNFKLFKHLFQFIKWEDTEPYNIEELLKGK